jgi:hypothetical protein
MDQSQGAIADVVKEFLASNGSATSERSAVVFEKLSIQGSGAGVSRSAAIQKHALPTSRRLAD